MQQNLNRTLHWQPTANPCPPGVPVLLPQFHGWQTIRWQLIHT